MEIGPGRIIEMLGHRSAMVAQALVGLDRSALAAGTELPGWTRLTVACHLRYGAQAVRQIVEATLEGRPSAYYPAGRELQRPTTLAPALGEPAVHVAASLRDEDDHLLSVLGGLAADAWDTPVIEHDDNPDLGDLSILGLVRLRLTEVVVHGTDLGMGLPAWQPDFGRAVLTQRLARRPRPAAGARWSVTIDATDAGAWTVTAVDGQLEVARSDAGAARLRGTANAHVAALLGRSGIGTIESTGDPVAARAYLDTCIGP